MEKIGKKGSRFRLILVWNKFNNERAPGNITGIDFFPIFIDLFKRNVEKRNLKDRVKGVAISMDNLPFRDEELDLMWSNFQNIGRPRCSM